jgi:hypothetical protein
MKRPGAWPFLFLQICWPCPWPVVVEWPKTRSERSSENRWKFNYPTLWLLSSYSTPLSLFCKSNYFSTGCDEIVQSDWMIISFNESLKYRQPQRPSRSVNIDFAPGTRGGSGLSSKRSIFPPTICPRTWNPFKYGGILFNTALPHCWCHFTLNGLGWDLVVLFNHEQMNG